jgi:hypothetical protein
MGYGYINSIPCRKLSPLDKYLLYVFCILKSCIEYIHFICNLNDRKLLNQFWRDFREC